MSQQRAVNEKKRVSRWFSPSLKEIHLLFTSFSEGESWSIASLQSQLRFDLESVSLLPSSQRGLTSSRLIVWFS